MKKFSKLLVFILSLALIITAFAVVALATDGDGAPSRSEPLIRNATGSWEGAAVVDGASIGTGTNGKRPAYVYAEVSADGNKYSVYTPSPEKGATGDMWYDTVGGLPSGTVTKDYTDSEGNPATKKVNKYNLLDYPYVVYDFDTMTPTGKFGSPAINTFSFRTYAYHYVDKEYGYGSTKAGNVGDTGNTALEIPVSAIYPYLDSTPYNWQHVTAIARAYVDDVNIKFEINIYVNGEFVKNTTTTAPSKFKNKLLEDLALSYVRQSSDKYPSDDKALVDFTGYVHSDVTTWPDSDPSEWYESKVAFDNPSFSNYKADWSVEEIAKASWERTKGNVPAKSEKSVASITKADGSIVYYADINAAIADAAIGEKVTVLADITTSVKVDKAIIVDAGMHYKQNGVDYVLGTHDFPHYSTIGMIAEFNEETGIYTFAQRDGLYTIEWDAECEGECDCPNGLKHIFKLTATAASGMTVLPAVGDKQSTFEVVNGLDVTFLGWSLTKGGEIIDIATIDAQPGETVKLYPIYDAVQYNLQVIKASGAVSYYKEAEFATAVANAGANGTVKLMTDIYTECAGITFSVNLTIDLNGHTLERCYVQGNVYAATSDGAGGYTYGTDDLINTNAACTYFFMAGKGGVKLTVTGEGKLYNVTMKADTWMDGDKIVKRTATGTVGNFLLNSNEKGSIELHITDGAAVYTRNLFYQYYASGGNYVINMDNASFYYLHTDAIPITGSGAYGYAIVMLNDNSNTMTFTNSTICGMYTGGGGESFIYLRTNGAKGDSTKANNITFKNCDFIRTGYGWSATVENDTEGQFTTMVYDNCRYYDVNHANFDAVDGNSVSAINGTLYRYYTTGQETPAPVGEGFEAVAKQFVYQYTVPTNVRFTINADGDVNYMDFDLGEKTHKLTYTHIITKPVDVNWVDENGNVIKTEQLRPGVDAITAPKYVFALDDDNYRNVVAKWVDENGNPIPDVLGQYGNAVDWQDSYTFRPVKVIDENTEYTGGLKDILFNISFTSNFRYNVYLPVYDDKITINSVSLFEGGNTVKIGGYEYAVYSFIAGTTAAAENTEFTVNFTYNGEAYEQTLKLSALLYADIILASSDVNEEKLAVGNMARFIMEARKVVGAEVDEDRFNAIITSAGVEDYKAEYVGDGSISALSDYIYSVSYVIYNGAASYKFVLNDASYADVLNFTLDGKEIGFTVAGTEGDKTYIILDTARVYDIIDTLTITVDGTELIATYSMLDNIKANPNSDLLKALYEFGIAAENYRAYLEANS